MAQFDINLPHIRQVQKHIKEAQEIEIKLINGEALTGKIKWQDPECVCLVDSPGQDIVVWRQAIAYLKPKH